MMQGLRLLELLVTLQITTNVEVTCLKTTVMRGAVENSGNLIVNTSVIVKLKYLLVWKQPMTSQAQVNWSLY